MKICRERSWLARLDFGRNEKPVQNNQAHLHCNGNHFDFVWLFDSYSALLGRSKCSSVSNWNIPNLCRWNAIDRGGSHERRLVYEHKEILVGQLLGELKGLGSAWAAQNARAAAGICQFEKPHTKCHLALREIRFHIIHFPKVESNQETKWWLEEELTSGSNSFLKNEGEPSSLHIYDSNVRKLKTKL